MAEFPRDYQLLVADDASTDKTSEVLTPYARVLPLTVVRTESRRGYAASLEMLLREAVRRSEYPKRDVIITIQADFSQEPEDIVPIIKAMEAGADIVCGESTLPAETAWKIRWSRRMAGKILKRKSVPQGVKDPFTGFRAYRVFTVKKAMDERGGGRLLMHDSWAANAELLAVTAPHARRIDPLDVTVRPHRLQRPSRLHPWPALKNVWAYARRAKPEIEAATTMELDDSVSSVATSRRTDASAVRERMTERSDMHGNRSPHGDRQPHNARPEPRGRNGGGRDRNAQGRPQNNERPRSADVSRTRTDAPRADAPRANAPRPERPKSERPPNPRGERKPKEPRTQNGDRPARPRRDSAAATADQSAQSELDLAAAAIPSPNGMDAEAVQPTGEPTKRRRRRGRRSRGGAKRESNGVEGDVNAAASDSDAADSSVASDAPAGVHVAPAFIASVPHNDAQSSANGDAHGNAGDDTNNATGNDTDNAMGGDAGDVAASGADAPAKKRRRGRRGGRGRRRQGGAAAQAGDAVAGDGGGDGSGEGGDENGSEPREAATHEAAAPRIEYESQENGDHVA